MEIIMKLREKVQRNLKSFFCSYMWVCVSAVVDSRHNCVFFRKSLSNRSTAGAFLYPLESSVGTHKYDHMWYDRLEHNGNRGFGSGMPNHLSDATL